MAKILITGGAGFIGSQVARTLANNGHDILILDNLHRASLERIDGLPYAIGDVRNYADVLEAVSGQDVVIHAAAQSNVIGAEADPDYCWSTNVAGTENVAAACARNYVEHLVFFSSREVYGTQAVFPVSETASLMPDFIYGKSKLAGEHLLTKYGVPHTIFRLANVFGKGDADRVLPLWTAAAKNGYPIILYGGDQVLDFVSVSSVVEAVTKSVAAGPTNCPINIGSGIETPLVDVARWINTTYGCELIFKPSRMSEVRKFVADVSVMRKLLGVVPTTLTPDVLGELFEYAKAVA